MNGASSPSPAPNAVITDDSGRLHQVGDWVLGATLGRGSFGKVKLACHHRTREKVAVKIVDKASISNVDDVERVYRETFILTTLKHAHIIKLYEVLDTADSILLVMEYAGGGELFSYVSAQRRLPEPESCRLFSQIIAGVEYCHRAKIIHRDLKLENILLTEHSASSPPSVKIADFGLSNSIRLNEKMGTNCGTPSYTCPEQISGQAYIGSAADIWSLGVIFFAMTCGFLPFEATSIPLLFKKIRAGHYRCPAYVSDEAKDLIGRMLTVDPERRATIAELRSHPWMLMDYTDLIDRIEQMQPVTAEMIEDAHLACQNWTGEEDRKEKEETRKLTAAAATAAPPAADSEQAAEADDRPDALSAHNNSIAPPITRPASTTPTIDAATSAASDGVTTGGKVAGRTRGMGGFRDREGSGGKASASMSAYAKAGHGAFEKLSIRTGGPTPGAGKGPASGNSRRGTEQPTSASSTSSSVTSPQTPTPAAFVAPSSGSSSSSSSHRHRKSISLAALNSSPSFSPADPPARLSLLTVRDPDSMKASTQPLRFPPISPTSGMSPAPHSAGVQSLPEELSSPVSASRAKGRLKAMPTAAVAAAAAAGLMEEKERDREATARQPAAASLPTTRRQKKDVISPITHPPPPSSSASSQESKEREREREEGSGSKAATRRPSMEALSGGGGGGYMADTTASRHRLLGKLNVDLSS